MKIRNLYPDPEEKKAIFDSIDLDGILRKLAVLDNDEEKSKQITEGSKSREKARERGRERRIIFTTKQIRPYSTK